ncbi:hypothetical protein ACIBHX_46485 [Nonomuraea sp. NPDC050536]|uniref:hypothetical protein n=1 Tax=Nonomuraea sp. NPDC050536 TaxID=3364366 RepID=UPI0037CA19DA
MLVLPPADIPGNTHHLSATSKTYVQRADSYRLSWVDVIERDSPQFRPLTEVFPEEFRPAGTFGVAGLESQEHSVLWIGAADLISQIEANPQAPIPFAALNERGTYADRWPNTDPWNALIPVTTWNPDGQGIVTEYPFSDGNGQVVVYELVGHPALRSMQEKSGQDLVPMVTFHCTRCHREGNSHDRYTSVGPADRRTVCRKARVHMQPGQCRGAEAVDWEDRMIATVEHVVAGIPKPSDLTGLAASRCQTAELRLDDVMAHSTCAEIREARKHTARHRPTR